MKFLLKYLIIPILVVGYLFFVSFLVQYNPPVGSVFEKTPSPGTEIIGVGESVTVSVTRPYLFGLIRLPIYSSALGDISGFHTLFFGFIIFLTLGFIIYDIIQLRRGNNSMEERRMDKRLTKILRSLGYGVVVGFVSWVLSGSDVSLPLGLLVAYLEYRFK